MAASTWVAPPRIAAQRHRRQRGHAYHRPVQGQRQSLDEADADTHPAKLPGPMPQAMPSSWPKARPAPAISSCTIGIIRSVWLRPAVSKRSSMRPSTTGQRNRLRWRYRGRESSWCNYRRRCNLAWERRQSRKHPKIATGVAPTSLRNRIHPVPDLAQVVELRHVAAGFPAPAGRSPCCAGAGRTASAAPGLPRRGSGGRRPGAA